VAITFVLGWPATQYSTRSTVSLGTQGILLGFDIAMIWKPRGEVLLSNWLQESNGAIDIIMGSPSLASRFDMVLWWHTVVWSKSFFDAFVNIKLEIFRRHFLRSFTRTFFVVVSTFWVNTTLASLSLLTERARRDDTVDGPMTFYNLILYKTKQ